MSEDQVLSRRTVLKRAGWIVPVLTVLPLSTAHAGTFGSPGPASVRGSGSGSGSSGSDD